MCVCVCVHACACMHACACARVCVCVWLVTFFSASLKLSNSVWGTEVCHRAHTPHVTLWNIGHDFVVKNGVINNLCKCLCVLSGECVTWKITSFLPSFSFSPVYQDEKAKHILFVFPSPLSYFLMLVVWLNLALERCASAYLVHLGHTSWLARSLGLGDRAQFVVSQLKGHVNSLLSLSGTCWLIQISKICWIREMTCFTGTGRQGTVCGVLVKRSH